MRYSKVVQYCADFWHKISLVVINEAKLHICDRDFLDFDQLHLETLSFQDSGANCCLRGTFGI